MKKEKESGECSPYSTAFLVRGLIDPTLPSRTKGWAIQLVAAIRSVYQQLPVLFGTALQSAVHWAEIQVPIVVMIPITAITRMPSRIVYSINAVPSSSAAKRLITFRALVI